MQPLDAAALAAATSRASTAGEGPHSLWLPVLLALLGLYALTVTALLVSRTCLQRPVGEAAPLQTDAPVFKDITERDSWSSRRVARGFVWKVEGLPAEGRAAVERTPMAKLEFLRKVYGILSTQLAMTVLIITMFVYLSFEGANPAAVTGFGVALLSYGWLLWWLLFIPMVVTLVLAHCFRAVHPWNLVWLFAFTFFESVFVGLIVVTYWRLGMGDLVLASAGIALFVFCLLTLYALFTKRDVSFWGPFLFVSTLILLVWSVVLYISIVFGGYSADAYMVFSLVGALIACGYIVYETWMLANVYGPDDVVLACIRLYTDIINLFLHVLAALGARRAASG